MKLPKKVLNTLIAVRNLPSDLIACLQFLLDREIEVSLWKRIWLILQFYVITFRVESPHTQTQILAYVRTILAHPRENRGVIVEAGCYKGSSTAKFSLAADLAGTDLVVFDSFQGIPDNAEPHDKNIFGGSARFKKGDYCGTLAEVKANVARFGRIDRCKFVEGWFEETLPHFKEKVSAIYLDVDLASSTRTCLTYLYPLLEVGGTLYSQDGHLPLVIEVFEDEQFWLNKVGCRKPYISGIGKTKLISLIKAANAN
jgi:O-methyltransferase